MKKRILAFSVSLVISFSCFEFCPAAVDTSAGAAVLMCAETGEILYSENPDKRLSMASTTKIMTSLIALEAATPEREIAVTAEMADVEGTSMGLQAGDSVSLEELVYGMLLQSGNDAANAVAIVLAGSEEKFAELMNKRAKEIGMKNSNFVTPSGLDDDEHYSTAYDMALLACECLKNPEFIRICSCKSARITYGNPPYARTLTNHNRLLRSIDGCIGIKTGFTQKSGRCLVSAVRQNGVTLVAVTLSDPDDWSDHTALYKYGFSVCTASELSPEAASVKVCGSDKKAVKAVPVFCPEFPVNDDITCEILLKKLEYAPIKKGDILGKAVYYLNGKAVYELPLAADEDVPAAVHGEKKENKLLFKITEKLRLFRRR